MPLLKSKIAKETPDNDIYLTEMLLDNVIDNLEPAETAALLSSFVCQ